MANRARSSTWGWRSSPSKWKPVAVADFFPTLQDPRRQPFVVVDRQAFVQYANAHSPRPVGGANELWVELAHDEQDAGFVTTALRQNGLLSRGTLLASEEVSDRVDTPLVSAGWRGLIVLMFLALVVAGVSGVVLFSYIDTQERRTELAVLRTLGFSRTQLNAAVWFSLLTVVVFGMGLGTWGRPADRQQHPPSSESSGRGRSSYPTHGVADRLDHSGSIVCHTGRGRFGQLPLALLADFTSGSAAGVADGRGMRTSNTFGN